MKRLFDAINENRTWYDALSESLDNELRHDLAYVKETYSDGLEEEKIDQVYSEYDMNSVKLEYVPEISELDRESQQRFTQMCLHTDYLDLDTGRKIETILSFAVLAVKYPEKIKELSNEEAYLISTVLTSVPASKPNSLEKDQFDLYSNIICDKLIIDKAMIKSSNMNERREVLREVLAYCDDNVDDTMSQNEYKTAILDINRLIDKYEIKTKPLVNMGKVA